MGESEELVEFCFEVVDIGEGILVLVLEVIF